MFGSQILVLIFYCISIFGYLPNNNNDNNNNNSPPPILLLFLPAWWRSLFNSLKDSCRQLLSFSLHIRIRRETVLKLDTLLYFTTMYFLINSKYVRDGWCRENPSQGTFDSLVYRAFWLFVKLASEPSALSFPEIYSIILEIMDILVVWKKFVTKLHPVLTTFAAFVNI